jgi:carbon monoxide dehydrogenase subunit G
MAPQPLQFDGSETFAAGPDRLFALLTDLDALSRIMPEVESAERIDARTLRCVVRPGFSFLRGKLNSTVQLADVVPKTSAVMHVHSKAVGVEMRVRTQWTIAPQGEGARLDWNAEVTELKGLVATLGAPLIRAAAEQTIRKSWEAVRAQLDPAPSP